MGRVMGDDPFESIVAAHHGEIHRYLARVTSRVTDADDLSQETFLRAFRAHRALAGGRQCAGLALHHRHQPLPEPCPRRSETPSRLAAASTDGFGAAPGWPEGVAQLNETSARIDRIVGELPFKQRAAFTMRKMHELDYDAIGEALTCSAESARAHVFQALKKIRRGLDDLNGSVHGVSAMSRTQPTCREIEPGLVAVGVGEASPATIQVVEEHVASCSECRDELDRYRALDRLVADMRRAPGVRGSLAGAGRAGIAAGRPQTTAAHVRHLLLAARSDLDRPLDRGGVDGGIPRVAGALPPLTWPVWSAWTPSRTKRQTRRLHQDLLDYLEGRRTRLGWSLDLRLASSDFQRRVLQVTSRLPYGAVTSYGHIAREIGEPKATRAVAQALRRNPLPIVIPCHRVIGGGGDLVGYAGNKVGLKQRLLTLEGVPVGGSD